MDSSLITRHLKIIFFATVDVSPADFRAKLKNYLRRHDKVKIDGYNPPPVDHVWDGLYVLEIERPPLR